MTLHQWQLNDLFLFTAIEHDGQAIFSGCQIPEAAITTKTTTKTCENRKRKSRRTPTKSLHTPCQPSKPCTSSTSSQHSTAQLSRIQVD